MTVDGTYFSSGADPWAIDTFVTASLFTLAADTGFVQSLAGIRINLLGGSRPGDLVVGQLASAPLGNVSTNMDPTSQRFDPADMRFTLTSSFLITPQNPRFAFSARLLVGNFSSFSADSIETRETVLDFGNTARLSIDAPPGITFVSDSGAFLVSAPVPEPATSALLTLGLGLLLATAARQSAGRLQRLRIGRNEGSTST